MNVDKRKVEEVVGKEMYRFSQYMIQDGDTILGYCDRTGCYVIVLRDEETVRKIKSKEVK